MWTEDIKSFQHDVKLWMLSWIHFALTHQAQAGVIKVEIVHFWYDGACKLFYSKVEKDAAATHIFETTAWLKIIIITQDIIDENVS